VEKFATYIRKFDSFYEEMDYELWKMCSTAYFPASFNVKLYLGHTKSSEPYFLISFLLLEKIFFSYKQIERLLLYLSMLFDKYSIDIMIMKSS